MASSARFARMMLFALALPREGFGLPGEAFCGTDEAVLVDVFAGNGKVGGDRL
jgi:hypothetical protein